MKASATKTPATTPVKAKARAPRKAAAKPPVKKGAVKNAAAKPLVSAKPKTPAKAAAPTTTKIKLVTPKKNWKIVFRDNSVNGAIVSALGDGADTLDSLVEYFGEHSGMAPNKSLQYKNKPKQYIADYITYLVKNNVVRRA